MRKITLLGLVAALLGCISVSAASAASDQPDSDEYAIYGVVLDQVRAGSDTKLAVVQSKTDSYQVRQGALEQHIAFINRGLPDIRDGVINDFFAKNERHWPIASDFTQAEVVGKQDLDRILGSDPYRGWERFYKRYPNSSGIIKLSRIGFDPQMTQAMVYVSRACGPSCGKGSYFLLTREGKNWIVAKELILWVL